MRSPAMMALSLFILLLNLIHNSVTSPVGPENQLDLMPGCAITKTLGSRSTNTPPCLSGKQDEERPFLEASNTVPMKGDEKFPQMPRPQTSIEELPSVNASGNPESTVSTTSRPPEPVVIPNGKLGKPVPEPLTSILSLSSVSEAPDLGSQSVAKPSRPTAAPITVPSPRPLSVSILDPDPQDPPATSDEASNAEETLIASDRAHSSALSQETTPLPIMHSSLSPHAKSTTLHQPTGKSTSQRSHSSSIQHVAADPSPQVISVHAVVHSDPSSILVLGQGSPNPTLGPGNSIITQSLMEILIPATSPVITFAGQSRTTNLVSQISGQEVLAADQNRKTVAPPLVIMRPSPVSSAAAFSNSVFESQTPAPGGLAITVSGTQYSLVEDSTNFVVRSSTLQLKPQHFALSTRPPVLSLDTQRISAISGSEYIIGAQTLTPEGKITVSGTSLTLASGPDLFIIGSSTERLHPQTALTSTTVSGGGSVTSTSLTASSSDKAIAMPTNESTLALSSSPRDKSLQRITVLWGMTLGLGLQIGLVMG